MPPGSIDFAAQCNDSEGGSGALQDRRTIRKKRFAAEFAGFDHLSEETMPFAAP